jgi:hypothetical protein
MGGAPLSSRHTDEDLEMGTGRPLGPYFKNLFSWSQSSLLVGVELILASFAYPIIHLIKIYINLRVLQANRAHSLHYSNVHVEIVIYHTFVRMRSTGSHPTKDWCPLS